MTEDTSKKYYTFRGIELPQAIFKVKQLGIDMSLKDAVMNANAGGQIDKIVADITDPRSKNALDIVENIWRFALNQLP